MTHILHDLHHELEHTHDLAVKYHYHNLSEIWYAIIWRSFKKALRMYALQKEQVLMSYATLHYDIETDMKDPYSQKEVWHVSEWIKHLTDQIDACSRLLIRLLPHWDTQEEIITHEKKFFVKLISSFQNDLIEWVGAHEREIFGESTIEWMPLWSSSLSKWQKLLNTQKIKLESYISTLSQK